MSYVRASKIHKIISFGNIGLLLFDVNIHFILKQLFVFTISMILPMWVVLILQLLDCCDLICSFIRALHASIILYIKQIPGQNSQSEAF